MKNLPKEDYDRMIAACDVGMIFLDYRFTIPNFPSRLLSYMQAGLPILACTDRSTDLGKVITEGGFGWWCESRKVSEFIDTIFNIDFKQIKQFSEQSFDCLNKNYTVDRVYKVINKEE